MKQILLALFFVCLFSSQALCQDTTYCGQITKFVAEPGKSKGLLAYLCNHKKSRAILNIQ